jgi:1-acyl-sn-glycerol-3-phosphate acyltransferase
MTRRSEDPHRWRRRLLSISAFGLLTALALVLLPIVLPLALIRDSIVRSRLAWVRCCLLLSWYMVCESWGVLASFGLWLARPVIGREPFVHAVVLLQRAWTAALTRGIMTLFSMRLEVEGGQSVERGPLILLVRHASVADTVLPMWIVAGPHRYAPRYVLKQELRWDPCLDIVGHWIPNAFVRRGDGHSEIERIARLGEGLGRDDLVVLFPEGTRFSPRARERRLAELRQRHDALLEQAERLRYCLPPRSGGALGLLRRAPGVDVAILAHVGLDSLRTMADIFDGALIERCIRVRMWRVAAAEIPDDDAGRRRWLFAQWAAIDDWIAAQTRDSAKQHPAEHDGVQQSHG